jgi:two-component system chemotaxis response regulator CheY
MAYSLEKIEIQLIEDNRNMRALVRSMLQALGMKNVRDHSNGQEAIDALSDYAPDLIITDWMMGPVDGLEYTNYIRRNIDSPDIFTPIVLMTGHTETRRIIMARDAGVTEVLSKPISAKSLYDRVLAVIEKPRPFVRTKKFFGPCRRRLNWEEYFGPERRFSLDSPNAIPSLGLAAGGAGLDNDLDDVERLLESL